jgi:hypothetical protein
VYLHKVNARVRAPYDFGGDFLGFFFPTEFIAKSSVLVKRTKKQLGLPGF